MKHKVKVMVEVERRSLFGKKKVLKERITEVDEKTCRKMKKEAGKHPYSIEEMMLYDEIFDDWDN